MSKFSEVANLYLPFDAVGIKGENYFITAVHDGWARWDDGMDIDEVSIEIVKPKLIKIQSLTDEQFLECGKILGGMSHLMDESIIFQVKELLTTNKLFNGQTNIPGIRWIRLAVYLFKLKVDLFGLIEAGEAVES